MDRNELRYNFVNKATGRRSYSIQPCYGNYYAQIRRYLDNMGAMCLLNVSNDTHYIDSVIDCNGRTLYSAPND